MLIKELVQVAFEDLIIFFFSFCCFFTLEEEGYYKFTEEDVDAIVDAANLRREEYERIKREVIRMGLESATHDDDDDGDTRHS